MGASAREDDDRYVTGGTNWEGYELSQLIAMVTEKVDVPALVRLADDWRWTGEGVVESANDLADALDELMDFWSGRAAEQARIDVALNAQWVRDLGSTANQIGSPIEDAAGALKAAQDQMPQLPVAPTVAPGSAPEGAEAASTVGGPLGAAIGGTAAGSESAVQAQEEQAQLKRQAVETMRRFESAAIGIDRSVPQFEGPSPVLRPSPEPKPNVAPITVTVTTDTVLSWESLTGAESGTGAQNYSGGAGPAAGGGSGGQAPGQGPAGGPQPGAGSGAGAAAPRPERGVGVMPAASAAMLDADGHAGTGGAPMGMGAGPGGNAGNDHRRRYPFDADDPFALDQKASPPVIGL